MKNPESGNETADYDKEENQTSKTISPDVLTKGKVYKYALKSIFGVFVVLAFLFFALSVDGYRYANVYRCVAAGHYGEGLDGRWDTVVFVMELFANIFKQIDLVLTPCALMVVIAFFGLCLAIAWVIMIIMKRSRTVVKAESGLMLLYALFAIIDLIMLCGLKYVYNSPVGAAPIALLVLAVACFAGSLAVFIMRNKYIKAHAEIVEPLQIIL